MSMEQKEELENQAQLEWSILGKIFIATQPIIIAAILYFMGTYLTSAASTEIDLAVGNLSKICAIFALFPITHFWDVAFYRKPTKVFSLAPWLTKVSQKRD